MQNSRHPRAGAEGSGRRRVETARVLALFGTVLTAFPLAAPLVLALVSWVASRRATVDYLMPGELFVVVLLGGVALVIAALLGRRLRAPVVIVLVAAALLLVVVDLVAAFAPAPARTPAVATVYALYVAAVLVMAVLGAILCRVLFARPAAEASARAGGTPSTR